MSFTSHIQATLIGTLRPSSEVFTQPPLIFPLFFERVAGWDDVTDATFPQSYGGAQLLYLLLVSHTYTSRSWHSAVSQARKAKSLVEEMRAGSWKEVSSTSRKEP